MGPGCGPAGAGRCLACERDERRGRPDGRGSGAPRGGRDAGGAGPDRHPGEQCRDHRGQRPHLGLAGCGVAAGHRGEPDRALSGQRRRAARHGGTWLWTHCQHRQRGGKGRQPQCLPLQRIQGRADRADKIPGQGIGRQGRAGELHHASRGPDRTVRADDRGADRLHAQQNPHGPLRQGGGDRRPGRVAHERGLLVLHRRGVRHHRGPLHLLTRLLDRDRLDGQPEQPAIGGWRGIGRPAWIEEVELDLHRTIRTEGGGRKDGVQDVGLRVRDRPMAANGAAGLHLDLQGWRSAGEEGVRLHGQYGIGMRGRRNAAAQAGLATLRPEVTGPRRAPAIGQVAENGGVERDWGAGWPDWGRNWIVEPACHATTAEPFR